MQGQVSILRHYNFRLNSHGERSLTLSAPENITMSGQRKGKGKGGQDTNETTSTSGMEEYLQKKRMKPPSTNRITTTTLTLR